MSNGIGLEALEDYVKRQKKRLKTEDRNARKERGRQLRQPLAVWFLFIPRLSRVTFRAGRSSRTSWSRGSRYSGSAICSGSAGRARGSRYSGSAICSGSAGRARGSRYSGSAICSGSAGRTRGSRYSGSAICSGWAGRARGSRYSGSAIFSGWAGRARRSCWSLKASCQSDRSHAQNEQGFNSHLGLQLHRGKSDAYWTR
jgi:hypothetical protein